MAERGAHATRSSTKAEQSVADDVKNGKASAPTTEQLQNCLVRVNHMLTLLDAPLAQGRSCRRPSSMHDGIVYSLDDLLIPMNAVLNKSSPMASSIGEVVNMPGYARGNTSRDMATYLANTATVSSALDQLVNLLKQETESFPESLTVNQVLQRQLRANPLTDAEEREIVLQMRQKRRRLTSTDDGDCVASPSQNSADQFNARSPLYPMPEQLSFSGLTPWIGKCVEKQKEVPVQNALEALVADFNETYASVCRAEATALAPIHANIGQRLPAHRIRARLARWDGDLGEICAEIRDVALIKIGLQMVGDALQIARITLYSPSELTQANSSTEKVSQMGSKFGLYNSIADQLFIYALNRQHHSHYLHTLGCTLEHLAALRTYFDPLPVPETQDRTLRERVAIGTLPSDKVLNQSACIDWKWCRALLSEGSTPQGEWCAYSPRQI
ncbi:hypothetical protein MYAM1_000452 [Malassezia yamatoensis]|uniref:Uncharacterized protein n=1 Tax=Malassezia yamatoensis TaxID=253288 RepID=A0AAJ5YR64_9BASI|nr:hypothetical protein MYAM1_000452 [Malassezia yamatoensis]